MTYTSGGFAGASDYNTLVGSVNTIWGVGVGNSGYGQTPLATVPSSSVLYAIPWNTLISTVGNIASHQATAINTSYRDANPTAGDPLYWETFLENNITLINNARLNAAAQGTTSSVTGTNTTGGWTDRLTFTFTVTFSGAIAARYFFNSGGQIAFTFSHPSGTGINATLNALASDIGTVVHSAPTFGTATIAGVTYNGVTKIGGGSPAGTSINQNNGYYLLTPTPIRLISQTGGGSFYSSTNLTIEGSTNGGGALTYTCVFDEIPNGVPALAGTTATLTVRQPSTTYITNSWGIVTVPAPSIVAV